MKIRQGFVSNSSSSSFVCFIEKGAHDQAMAQMKQHEHFEVLQQIVKGMSKDKFMGRDVMIYESSDSHGETWVCGLGSFEEFDYEKYAVEKPEGFEEELYEVWERVVDGVWEEYCKHVSGDMMLDHTVEM